MNKISYMVLGSFMIYSTTTALNLECVHASIQSAIIESTSLQEYQTAWQDICTIYLESEKEIAPLIEHAIHVAQEQKGLLEQTVTSTASTFPRDKQMITCGAGKLAVGAYLALGLIVLPLSLYKYTQSQTLVTACFLMPTTVKKFLEFFVTHRPDIDISLDTIDKIDFGFVCTQWIASLVIAPYLLYKGAQKIDAGLTYADRLNTKIVILDHIIRYMHKLKSDTLVMD